MTINTDILQRLRADIDSTAASPLYLQLDQSLRNAIEEGLLSRGDALPPERVLADGLGISRVTVRKTIERLERAGFCSRRRGAGTFVSGPASIESGPVLPQSLSALRGFSEDMLSRGLTPSSRLIDKRMATPTAEEMFSLNLKREKVLRLTRVRLADDKPMALEVCCVPSTILTHEGLVTNSVYSAMSTAGHMPVRAIQRISACVLEQAQAEKLEVEAGAPALYIRRAAYDAEDHPIEYTCSYFRADRFDFVAELVSR